MIYWAKARIFGVLKPRAKAQGNWGREKSEIRNQKTEDGCQGTRTSAVKPITGFLGGGIRVVATRREIYFVDLSVGFTRSVGDAHG